MTPTPLHVGKLTKEITTNVTEEFYEALCDAARASNCKPSDLMREGLFLLITGDSYSGHVAKDIASAFKFLPGKHPEKSGTKE